MSYLATRRISDFFCGPIRAELCDEGAVEHPLEPGHHGDPVDGGILCFYFFGWSLWTGCTLPDPHRRTWTRRGRRMANPLQWVESHRHPMIRTHHWRSLRDKFSQVRMCHSLQSM